MADFLIVLMIWMGLLDPTVVYTNSQVQQLAANNSAAIESASIGVDTTSSSWQYAVEEKKTIIIIDPNIQ